ncbi:VWA domain-containing protein [Actinoplanes sp. NPDC026670]|uniref:caspase, EACC1-associated type n=1 Tax=Actinoplanes sp. NPDC026670 TaxID=3154700 RepID=UPI0033F72E41
MLIGTAKYRSANLPDLPAVAHNIAALKARLTDPELSGFTNENCAEILNPRLPGQMLKRVRQSAKEAEELLLVYFAGHGLLDRDGELHLGVRDSHEEEPWTSVRFDALAGQILESPATSKIVILDCCYSGRALHHLHMSEDRLVQRATAQLGIDGLYVITSSAANKPSLAPEGDEFTAFTGRLLKFIDDGLPGPQELLTMQALYTAVRQDMQRHRLPRPQQYIGNLAGEAALVRNRAYAPAAPAEPADEPASAPADIRRARRPAFLAAHPRWRRAVGGGLVLAVLTGTASASVAAAAAPCAAPAAIRMLVPLDTVEMFTDIADAYEYATRGAGFCQRVRVSVAGASRDDVARAFALSWRTPAGASAEDRRVLRRVGLPPDVWVADLSADMAAVQATLTGNPDAGVRIPGDPARWPIAESPVVLAEPGEPGGTPAARPAASWSSLVAGGEPRPQVAGIVRPDPDTTTVGRLVDVSLFPAGQSPAVARNQVQLPLDAAAAAAGQGIGAPDVAGMLCAPTGSGRRTGVIVAEWQLVRHNLHRCGGRAAPWNAWYPGDTRLLDYPMVQPGWSPATGERIRRTADDFTAWIRSPAGGRALADRGLRPRNTGPDTGLISRNGAWANWYAKQGYETDISDLERAEKAYHAARKPATVLVAIDGSGSMTTAGGGRTRFDAALDGIAASVGAMGPRDEFGLFIFSTAIRGDITDLSGDAATVTGRARGYRPSGSTPLYLAVDHGVRRLRGDGASAGDRYRVLVVLTDGEDTTGHPLPRLDDDSIRVVVVNVGMSGCPDPRLAALTREHGACVGVPSGSVDVSVAEQIERLWQKETT